MILKLYFYSYIIKKLIIIKYGENIYIYKYICFINVLLRLKIYNIFKLVNLPIDLGILIF